ncbi:hypothetical protein LXJ58_30245, partial [Escherichia coli]|nr:hypothetical protein [Escherichia coli]
RRERMYRGKASIAVLITHRANKVASGDRLFRHIFRKLSQCCYIDRLARRAGWHQLGYQFAPAQNLHSLSRFDLIDQLTEMRFRFNKIDCTHPALLTI